MHRKALFLVPLLTLAAGTAGAAGGAEEGTVKAWPEGARTVDPEKNLPMDRKGFGLVNETLGNPHSEEVLAGETGENHSPFPPFAELDENGDGKLDEQEVAGIDDLNRQFEAADVNQDGSLDRSEFSAFEVTEGVMPGLENPPIDELPVEPEGETDSEQ